MSPSGPSNAKIMIVGDAPSEFDLMKNMPFCSTQGMELDRMLNEAGILRSQCFVTNVCHHKPPANDMGEWLVATVSPPRADNAKYSNKEWVSWRGKWCHPAVRSGYEQLVKHIALVRPSLVIALGNTALFALTGEWGIKSWRGSQLEGSVEGHTFKVIPAYHPSAVVRDWSTRAITVHDFRRAAHEAKSSLPYNVPSYDRIIRPNFTQVVQWFAKAKVQMARGQTIISADFETRGGHPACFGMYVKGLPTICIPFMVDQVAESQEDEFSYWARDQEFWIWRELRALLTHRNCRIVGQNWSYDSQYLYRFMLVTVPVFWDTMVTQHCIFPGMPKGLDYLSSMYCQFHRYWKDDIKDWDPKMGELQFWKYNCEDCERTYEVYEAQRPIIEKDPRLSKVWDFQTNTLSPLLFKAMCRGIRANVRDKVELSAELGSEIKIREKWLSEVLGHEINWGSPKQLQQLFFKDFKQRPVMNRKTGGVTTNDEALQVIAKREPVLKTLTKKIQELRSIGVFKSTFVEARLDKDQRIRCSFNIGGTVTFRLSSSENAFYSGLNLQNIPSGSEDAADGELSLPNIRKLFVPDEGMEMFDIDLKNADFYTMVWETDDEVFREALLAGVDTHLLNAGTLFEISEITLERLKDPEFEAYAKKKYKKPRAGAKAWVHGTNYGGKERTMAAAAGITIRESERNASKYFGEHPKIKKWHERTEQQLMRHRWVENKFGYRCTFFDRPEGLLPEALGWVPQSTTGCVINRAWSQINERIPEAEILIQVHDSLVGQYPVGMRDQMLTSIPECAKVVVPYEKPLIIPVGMKTSPISWGHCG